jgi:hypothetical protein
MDVPFNQLDICDHKKKTKKYPQKQICYCKKAYFKEKDFFNVEANLYTITICVQLS